jgi:hypothetical protein
VTIVLDRVNVIVSAPSNATANNMKNKIFPDDRARIKTSFGFAVKVF